MDYTLLQASIIGPQYCSKAMITRRRFCRSAAAAINFSKATLAATEYDLLIRSGRVLDPGRSIDARLDVAIRGGHIVALKKGIPVSSAVEVVDAEGRLVVPRADRHPPACT